MRQSFFAIVVAASAAAAPAATPVTISGFQSIALNGGGQVVVRHGPQQRVTLIAGTLKTSRLDVDHGGRLEILTCVTSCSDYRLEVEIVTPGLDGVDIRGGGSIRTEGDFRDREDLALRVSGGGQIDATAIPAYSVAAAIRGGGQILTRARERLVARIDGGGVIGYRGEPRVTSGIRGGGSVRTIAN